MMARDRPVGDPVAGERPGVGRIDLRAAGRFAVLTLFLRRRARPLWDNSPRTTTHRWLLVAVAALCCALAGFWLARELDSSAPQLASGTRLGRPRTVADFQLSDHF